MSEQSFRYHHRGVSASKDEVHQAIQSLDKGLFPNAFCKILPDLTSFDPAYCNVMHADTAGTKTSLAYMYWKETGDLNVWKGIVEDALVMNLDDMACVGCVDHIVLSSTIGRNKHLIPGEVIRTIIEHAQAFIEKMSSLGIQMYLAGGETADVGDIVRTIDVGYTTFCRIPKKEVVDINIQEGDVVVGFSSSGQATYESEYNGGLGSNGLTSARHDVFYEGYRNKYPESFSAEMSKDYAYTGSYKLTDTIEIEGKQITVGKLVLSPTRTYMPLIRDILKDCRPHLHGLIHCSGGGQTKVSKFLHNHIRVVKNNLLPVPPLFDMIQKESGAEWEEMYKVFNMGHRLEAYTSSVNDANKMIDMASRYHIEAQIIGKVVASDKPGVTIQTKEYTIDY